jgi:hypothetical protein
MGCDPRVFAGGDARVRAARASRRAHRPGERAAIGVTAGRRRGYDAPMIRAVTARDAAAAGDALREYAERGVFRGFAEAPRRGGGRDYEFRWLAGTTFRVRLDPRARRLVWSDVLPEVPARSPMDRAFRAWVRERSSERLPAHRRIDPRRVALVCTNRGGRMSVALALRRRAAANAREDWTYAARRGVSLMNEIFHGFLRGPYYEYMVRHFGEIEE